MKVGVEDVRERILSLCTVKTHPYLPTLAVRDFDETSGCGETGGLVGVSWIGRTVDIVE